VFHELLEAGAIDENHAGDVDVLRFYLAERVEAAILVTFDKGVMVTRLPTALGGGNGLGHDLTGIQDGWLILRFIRAAALGEECSRSNQHEQEILHRGFSE